MQISLPSPLQKINNELFTQKEVAVFVKRDDLIHPQVSGNKFRKLQYALKAFKENKVKTAATFGGAYSNHIHAFAYACMQENIKAIGIIRGEELASKPLNPTLQAAKAWGMDLIFVSRQEYAKRYDETYHEELSQKFDCAVVPEGGTQLLAKQGVMHCVEEINAQEPDITHIVCAVGSGGTIAGVVSALHPNQKALGVLAVSGVATQIVQVIESFTSNKNYDLILNAHLGGYAKTTPDLISFIKNCKVTYGLELEQVYTGKAFKFLVESIEAGNFAPGSKICFIHTGGMQGLSPDLK